MLFSTLKIIPFLILSLPLCMTFFLLTPSAVAVCHGRKRNALARHIPTHWLTVLCALLLFMSSAFIYWRVHEILYADFIMDYWDIHDLKGAEKWYTHTDNTWISFRYDGVLVLRHPENYRDIPCKPEMVNNSRVFDAATPLTRFRCLDGRIRTEPEPGNMAQGYSRIVYDTKTHKVLFTVPDWYIPFAFQELKQLLK
jgi:hypothetical protein